MKFEAGKSYRLIDPEGFKNESHLNATYFMMQGKLKRGDAIKCSGVNDDGAGFESHIYLYNHERKYFEEIG